MLTLLLNNWKLVAIVVAIATCVLYIRHAENVRTERDELQSKVESLVSSQRQANAVSASFETKLAEAISYNEKLKERLNDEVSNPVYTSCTATPAGLRIVNDARLGRSTK